MLAWRCILTEIMRELPGFKKQKQRTQDVIFVEVCSGLVSDTYWKLLPGYLKTAQTPFSASTSLWHFGSLKTLLELVGERAAALHFLMK